MTNVVHSGAETVAILAEEPGRRFYHSCQLRDLESHVAAGAILSRERLIALGRQACTPYESDARNRERGALGHVFGNLADNASSYRFLAGLPDIYGPIHLEFALAALEEFPQVTLRRHGISAPDPGVIDDPADLRALYHPELRDRVRAGYRGEIEGHAAQLSFVQLRRIVVLPIVHGGRELMAHVSALVRGTLWSSGRGPDFVVRDAASDHLAKLVEWARASASEHGEGEPLPAFVTFWLYELAEHAKLRATAFDPDAFVAKLRRFARSLEHGTLSRMRGEDGALTFNLPVRS